VIYDLLSKDMPKHVDEIINDVEIPAGRVTALLMDMELNGYIRQESGMLFMRAR
jgi:predicted Rossmann fold nucleotide-binding protein DprA/Smf involved in DNA uptake